ncbi:hypothetical protein PN470_10880 [Microcystis sp. CS-574]|uniref:hypothetical protein n=1 Tax=Microcystis sp. CS-574 TaxID=3021718 RepID=UPI00232F1C57|nr:hypothetical protein [Microcystis sp. CS-574]MDB9404779.1 hypothetical protein [Microcystis sp. CS-574]
MINADQLKDRMRLWTPDRFDEIPAEETSNNLIICGQALADFFSLKITPTEYLDVVESCEVNVDEYLEIINENLYDFVSCW